MATKDPLDHKPQKGYFVYGKDKATPPDKMVSSVGEIKAPDWIKRFDLFVSPSGSKIQRIVYEEYGEAINDFLMQNPDATITDVRKAVGVIVSPDGHEALTQLGDRVRRARESQQKTSVVEQGKPVQDKFKPPKFRQARKMAYLDTLSEVLEEHDIKLDKPLGKLDWEGHHIKGLGNLQPFYKGASEADKFELNQTLINNGWTAGETRGNFAWLSKKQHDIAHKKLGWGAEEAMFDIDKPSKKLDYDPNAPTSPQKGVTAISEELQKKITEAPFKRPDWQEDLLKKGVLPEDIDDFKLTRSDYLKEWMGLTDEAYQQTIDTAIRENPIKGIDPELQIKANARHANPQVMEDIQSIGRRGANGWSLNGAMKASVGLNRAESVVRIMGGDYIGGGLGLAMSSPTAQKQIAKQLGKLAIRSLPGVSLGSGALQALGYMKGGNWTKAGLSFMGGIIGEIPGYGDVVQSGIDLSLTGHDVVTKPKGFKKPKPNIPNEDSLYRTLRSLGENVSLNPGKYI